MGSNVIREYDDVVLRQRGVHADLCHCDRVRIREGKVIEIENIATTSVDLRHLQIEGTLQLHHGPALLHVLHGVKTGNPTNTPTHWQGTYERIDSLP